MYVKQKRWTYQIYLDADILQETFPLTIEDNRSYYC